MEKYAVSRLVGAPPGYVGYEEGGQLTEKVRQKPYSVVLLDEIEKAHPDVFSLLLQVLDDGRLTDSWGHVVDFRNTVVIMTSNIGTKGLNKSRLGFNPTSAISDYKSVKTKLLAEVKKAFNPEFINRLDEIVVFHSLERDHLRKIVDLQIDLLRQRLAERRIVLDVAPEALDLLAREGHDPQYGARPLKRLIQRRLQNPLAMRLLEGGFADGDTVRVTVGPKGDLELRKG
jgi:ATP-dependent Clp protease ATP-binding subunit ClpA